MFTVPISTPTRSAEAEAEKTAAAKRAAEVRKKLLSGASETEVQPIPVADEGGEDDSPPSDNQQHPQASKQNDAEENDPQEKDASGKEEAGEEGESPDPMSIWG